MATEYEPTGPTPGQDLDNPEHVAAVADNVRNDVDSVASFVDEEDDKIDTDVEAAEEVVDRPVSRSRRR